jgi:hypothetical protein
MARLLHIFTDGKSPESQKKPKSPYRISPKGLSPMKTVHGHLQKHIAFLVA